MWRVAGGVALLLLLTGVAWAAEKPAVYPTAILSFQERGPEVRNLGPQVTDLLFANLVAEPSMYLVDREDLQRVLKEQELNISGVVKPDEATKVGQLTGAKVLVTGSVLQVDSKLHLVAKIIGTETTRVLGATVTGNPRDQLDQLVKQLAVQVVKTINTQGAELVAKPKTREDRLAAINKAIGQARRPKVVIEVPERHLSDVGPPATGAVVVEPGRTTVVVSTRRAALDPAAETEIAMMCRELGFEVIDAKSGQKKDAEVLLVGEGFSEFATRQGNLVSVKARLELKAIEPTTGRVLAVDRQTRVEVDLTEQVAGKTALQEAAADILERMLPKLVRALPKK